MTVSSATIYTIASLILSRSALMGSERERKKDLITVNPARSKRPQKFPRPRQWKENKRETLLFLFFLHSLVSPRQTFLKLSFSVFSLSLFFCFSEDWKLITSPFENEEGCWRKKVFFFPFSARKEERRKKNRRRKKRIIVIMKMLMRYSNFGFSRLHKTL